MIVQLQDGTAYDREGHEYVPGPYYAGKDGKKFQEAYKADAEAAGFTLEEVRRVLDEARGADARQALRMLAENAARKAAQMEQQSKHEEVDSMDIDEASTDGTEDVPQAAPIALPDTEEKDE